MISKHIYIAFDNDKNKFMKLILTYIFSTLSRVSFNFFRLSFSTFSFNGGGCMTLYSVIMILMSSMVLQNTGIMYYCTMQNYILTHAVNFFHFLYDLSRIFTLKDCCAYQLSLLLVLFQFFFPSFFSYDLEENKRVSKYLCQQIDAI